MKGNCAPLSDYVISEKKRIEGENDEKIEEA